MRSAFHPLPCFVFDPFRGKRDAASVRAQCLQRIPKAPFAALLAVGDAIFPAVHRTHELPLADIGSAVGGLFGLLAAEIEARRVVPVAGAGKLCVHLRRQFKVIVCRVGQIGVQCLAVGGGDAGHIVEGLGAAFDLQAVHARLADQVNEGRGAQIVGVKDVAAVLVFADLVQLAGAGLLAQVVLPAAGLGALATVGVTSGHVVRQQAPAGHAHAHRTVHKGLDLQLRRGLIAQDGNIL